MPESALVTGATGFIGAALCRALVADGYQVRALHRKTSSLEALAGLPAERVVGDILEPETLGAAMRGVDWVFHTATQTDYWRHPELSKRTTVEGTRNVLQAALAANVQRVLYTSSLASLGVPETGEPLTEDHAFNLPPDLFPYGYAKHLAEQEARRYAAQGLEVVILNPSVVIGPGDVHLNSGAGIIEAAHGWGFFWTEGGVNVVHIDDVVAGHLAAARHGKPAERYLLAGENLTHLELFSLINEVVGRRPPWLKVPIRLLEPLAWLVDRIGVRLALPFNGAIVRMLRYTLFCDASRSRGELHLPEPQPARKAIEEAYAWYQVRGLI